MLAGNAGAHWRDTILGTEAIEHETDLAGIIMKQLIAWIRHYIYIIRRGKTITICVSCGEVSDEDSFQHMLDCGEIHVIPRKEYFDVYKCKTITSEELFADD